MDVTKPDIKFKGIYEIEHHHIPEWNEENGEMVPSFFYLENRYFLDEIMDLHNKVHMPNPPEWTDGFDGILSDSFFSGYLVKIIEDGDAVKLYLYLS